MIKNFNNPLIKENDKSFEWYKKYNILDKFGNEKWQSMMISVARDECTIFDIAEYLLWELSQNQYDEDYHGKFLDEICYKCRGVHVKKY